MTDEYMSPENEDNVIYMYGDMSDDNLITIPIAEYDDLLADSDFLDALEQAGVEKWEGYRFALDIFEADQSSDD